MLQLLSQTSRLSRALVPAGSARLAGAGSTKTRPARSIVKTFRRLSQSAYSRTLYTTARLCTAEKETEEVNEAEAKAKKDDVDYTMLNPKGAAPQAANTSKKARVFTEEQKERSRKAMKVLLERVLNSSEPAPKENQNILDMTKAGRYSEVVSRWRQSENLGYQLTLTAYNCIMISLVKMEEEFGDPADVERAATHIYYSGRTPNPLAFFILIDYFSKIHEFHKSRMFFAQLLDAATAFIEDAQDSYDALEEQGSPIPPHLQPPFYGLHSFCGFESMEEFKNAASYYVLLVSKTDGKSGPLSRKRIIEAMSKQWAGTEFGAASPLDDTEALLHAEEKISHDFLKDHHHIHFPHLSKDK